MDDTIDIEALIKRAGGVSALARAAGCDHSSVCGWRKTRRVPIGRVRSINRNLGIPLYRLRPDVFPAPKSRQNALHHEGSSSSSRQREEQAETVG